MSSFEQERKAAGRLGEQIAAEFLRSKGFKIIEMNYRKPWGEIDIIAEKLNTVRFVEVKTLSQSSAVDVSREKSGYSPEERVHPWKLKKLSRTAELYMSGRSDGREYQIDVVGVFLNKSSHTAKCRLFEQVL